MILRPFVSLAPNLDSGSVIGESGNFGQLKTQDIFFYQCTKFLADDLLVNSKIGLFLVIIILAFPNLVP